MPTYLLNWNPKRAFKWTENADESARTRREEPVPRDWSTGGTKRIVPGDRIFVGKQGVEPKGVIASGYAISKVFEKAHFGDPSKQTTYNSVSFDTIVDPESVLPRSELLEGVLGGINWDSEKGGITINPEAAVVLEEKWQDWLDKIGFDSRGDLEDQSVRELFGDEGKVRLELHRSRERDSSIVRAKKRTAWNTLQKLACEVCEFDYAKKYGQHGEYYIECHHRTPLRDVDREKGQRTQLDDLALVCANCHRMLHRGSWPSVDELRSVLAARH
jgi:5-methylcytosine-specific restriction protein A